jgi:hypothetical protein
MRINIAQAILGIKSNAQISYSNEDINTLEWHDGNPTNITNEQIIAKQLELQTEEDNKIAQQESKKQSAIAKLKALGLDEEEVKAILGV